MPLKILKVRRATLVLKARRESEALQVLTVQQACKAPLAQKETLVIPDRPARAPMLPHRPEDILARKPIFTLTLPQCVGLQPSWQQFKGEFA